MSSKLAPDFAASLRQGDTSRQVCAFLVVNVVSGGPPFARSERRARREAMKAAVEAILPELDDLLARQGGRRLPSSLDALGIVAVETSAAGVLALAEIAWVAAILSEQLTTAADDAAAGQMSAAEFSRHQLAVAETARTEAGAPESMSAAYASAAFFVIGGQGCGDPDEALARAAAEGVDLAALHRAAVTTP